MYQVVTAYAVLITRQHGPTFASGEGGYFHLSVLKKDAQRFLDELRKHGVGKRRGDKVVKVRVTVETI